MKCWNINDHTVPWCHNDLLDHLVRGSKIRICRFYQRKYPVTCTCTQMLLSWDQVRRLPRVWMGPSQLHVPVNKLMECLIFVRVSLTHPTWQHMFKKPLTSSFRFCVSLYSWGSKLLRRSRINDGLLCAAELKATNATLRTFKSASFNVSRKSPMLLRNKVSMGWGCNK